MDLTLILQNAVSILVSIGAPAIVLLILATELGKWHDEHLDPPPEAFEEEEDH